MCHRMLPSCKTSEPKTFAIMYMIAAERLFKTWKVCEAFILFTMMIRNDHDRVKAVIICALWAVHTNEKISDSGV